MEFDDTSDEPEIKRAHYDSEVTEVRNEHNNESTTDVPLTTTEHNNESTTDVPFTTTQHNSESTTDVPFTTAEHNNESTTDAPFTTTEHNSESTTDFPFTTAEHNNESTTDAPFTTTEHNNESTTDFPFTTTEHNNESTPDVPFQVFNDPVHGFIEIHPLLVKIIQTPQFERLKDIKQLGVCYWVFPGASHNRFEHCLGTSYLCGKLIDTLCKLHQNQIEITLKESLCVKIAGLCHDLGHGPFSHFFDGVYIPHAIPGSEWQHEQASCDLFELMIMSNPGLAESFKDYGLGRGEIVFIKELILGKNPEKDNVTRICSITGLPKWFLYEIVSNKRSGIDCDKFDYFARDCVNVGVNSNFDYRRYFQNVRILPIDQQLQICVRDKEVFNLYELFHTRWSLHHRVYQHKTQAPIQDLLLEAFLKVDKILRISESIKDMKRYTVLTDSLMYDILRNESKDANILEAQELLRKIQRRELYKFCGQTQTGSDNDCANQKAIAKELADISKGTLKPEQIFISIIDIHFGMKHRDPVDSVVFYNKSHKPMRVRKEQVSQILPQKFHERYLRVYAKSREHCGGIERCFQAWCSNKGYPIPHLLDGDRSGYFSPAFKLNQLSSNGEESSRGNLNPRALQTEFDNLALGRT